MAESGQIVNLECLDESCGGDREFARELFGDFQCRSNSLYGAIRAALETGDAERLRKASHELKGSSLTLGLERLARLSCRLEALATQSDLAEAGLVAPTLDEELGEVWQALKAMQLYP